MAGLVKNKEKFELVAGLITMGVALLLVLFAILFLSRCTAEAPEAEGTGGNGTMDTVSTAPTLPALVTNPYNHNDFYPVTDGFMVCSKENALTGIDVSYHQGYIHWDKVAAFNQGETANKNKPTIDFAMVRIGRRFADSGTIQEDPMWLTNVTGAREHGLLVGVYFFSQAINPAEALEEAQFVISLLDGMALDLPVVFDWEFMGETDRTAHMDAATLNACAKTFCDAIAAAGYTPMVYFNEDLSSRLLDLQQMQYEGYAFWLAKYSTQMTYPYKIQMWQYTDKGVVDGINGNVDLNLYFTYE